MIIEPGREVLERLLEQGFDAAEVFVKKGRSRRFELGRGGAGGAGALGTTEATHAREEAGWSVRAGASAKSFFFAAAGSPRPADGWPEAVEGPPLVLPRPAAVSDWVETPDVAEPLLAEDEGWRLLRPAAGDLERRLPGAAFSLSLDDGASECRIFNHHGVDAGHRGRFASLRLDLRTTIESAGVAVTVVLTERSARRLAFATVADRAVDLLAVRGAGSIGGAGNADMVLAPEVAARLLAPIAGSFVDQPREAVAAALGAFGGGDRIGAPEITLIDDGRHPRGLLAAPVDGEGVPTGHRVLIEAGRLAETVLPWERSGAALGSRARAGWRDLPRVALTHCFVEPREEVEAASLIGDLADGCYLLDAGEGGSYDLAGGFFSLPVWGFRVAAGRLLHPLGEASLVGDPRRLLDAVCAVASDLRLVPWGVSMIGAPSLLVRGLTLQQGGG